MKTDHIRTGKRTRAISATKKSAGFSLFELTAFIIIAAIIYSVAVNRFNSFPEAAERANFLAVLTQLQSALNLEIMLSLTSGNGPGIEAFQDSNPMDFLLKAPSNYRGEFAFVDASMAQGRSWYFDRGRGELVYVVGQAENLTVESAQGDLAGHEIRFRVETRYRDPNSLKTITRTDLEAMRAEDNGGSALRLPSTPSGAVIAPVTDYTWNDLDIETKAALASN